MHFWLSQRGAFLLFGIYDLLCIVWYWFLSLMLNHIPYWSDFEMIVSWFTDPSSSGYWLLIVWFGACYLSNVSILASCLLFFLNKPVVKYVVYFQLPLRWFLLIILLMFIGAGAEQAAWLKKIILWSIFLFFFSVEVCRTRYMWLMKPWIIRKALAPYC
jgi:hypothetical protein